MRDSLMTRILTYESEYIPGSTIGKHLRHSLDHFRLLLDAVPASSNAAAPLQVNYDTRTRLLDMERKPAIALQSFQIMSERLSRVMERTHLDKSVQLSALTPHYQQFESSFGREVDLLTRSSALVIDRCGQYTALVRSPTFHPPLQPPKGDSLRRAEDATSGKIWRCAEYSSSSRLSEGSR